MENIITTTTTSSSHEIKIDTNYNYNNNNSNTNITHDFMRVESFSQLPFIRPPVPPLIKLDKPIRLFGIEFSPDQTSDNDDDDHTNNVKHQEPAAAGESTTTSSSSNNNNINNNNNRKFECHYCCRNFPTSQALGGHQNAHKRERQHAKRAHLHSAAILHGAIGPWPSSPTSSLSHYPSSSRFYENHHGSYYSHPPPPPPPQQPINGNPMGLWRINPTVQTSSFHRDRPLVHSITPLFTDNNNVTDPSFKPRPPQSLMMGGHIIGSSPPSRYFYDSKSAVQDHHVSLDLHL